MNKLKHHIKFLVLDSMSAIQIFEKIRNVYDDFSSIYATVTKRIAEFKNGSLLKMIFAMADPQY